jgi:hypothetical protein
MSVKDDSSAVTTRVSKKEKALFTALADETAFLKTIAGIPPENLVYADESGLEWDYVREYGRARLGRKF